MTGDNGAGCESLRNLCITQSFEVSIDCDVALIHVVVERCSMYADDCSTSVTTGTAGCGHARVGVGVLVQHRRLHGYLQDLPPAELEDAYHAQRTDHQLVGNQ